MTIIKNKITKQEVAALPTVLFPGRIYVINSEAEALKAVQFLQTQPLVGVDTETRPSFKRGQVHKVALLQISTADVCFLFRLNRLGMPDFLVDFLQSDVLKVGLSLKDDFMMLRKRENSSDPRKGNWIELQDYIPAFGLDERSLQKIYALLFHEKISKNQRLTNWEADVLTDAQQYYAATDAWACVRIYNYVEQLKAGGQYSIEQVPEPVSVPQPAGA